MRTSAGVLAIESCDAVTDAEVTSEDAARAGFPSREAALAELNVGREGEIYRIRFRLAGPDPRIVLRENPVLTDADVAAIGRLPWARAVMELIARSPGAPAGELAAVLDIEKKRFKLDVRKLKELGLTESLGTGYRLSPRGAVFLKSHVR